MQIAIDIRTLQPERTGVGNYVQNLVTALLAGPEGRNIQLVARPENLEELKAGMGPAAARALTPERIIAAPLSHESHPLGDLWTQAVLPRLLLRRGVEVFHGPMVSAPFFGRRPASVVTVHDLVPLILPETVPRKYALYMGRLLRLAVRRAEAVISPSQSTKDDLVRLLGADPERVAVVPEAAPPVFRPVDDPGLITRIRTRLGIKGPFMIHLGNIEPRKNLVRLVRAFLLARKEVRGGLSLVVTGRKAWLHKRLLEELGAGGLPLDVIFTGYLPQGDLPVLMSAARAFLFPTLYEGFGLPVLEAMACGTPVLTSRRGSLPEVAGEAALYADPLSVEDMARGIMRLAGDDGLRQGLSREGLKRAAGYSWEKSAAATLEAFQAAGQRRGT